MIEGKTCGLIMNHAYSINDIIEFPDRFDKSKKNMIKLLRLRNPWGKSEWKFAWSDKSKEKQMYEEDIDNYIQSLPPDEQFDPNKDDGTFMMHYNDWRDQFSTLFLNIDFPEDWTGVRFKSAWTKTNSAGLPHKHEKELLEKYGRNPQFMVTPMQDTYLMFSMTQIGGRLPLVNENHQYQYSEYPFMDQLKYANVAVFKLDNKNTGNEKNSLYLKYFDKENLIFCSPIKQERDNSGRVLLKKGSSYMIVCATENSKQKGKFFLSVYFNQALRDVDIKRCFHPADMNSAKDEVLPYFIPEEAEKLVNQTPVWKIKLVKDSLKYMMTDEDTGAQF